MRRMSRGWIVLAFAMIGLAVAGCDTGDGGGNGGTTDTNTTASTDSTSSGSQDYDLTGRWRMKTLKATYKLRQSGKSLQGTYYEPDDPTIYGDIAGVVDGDEVAMYVAVTYETHPADNFTARKDGVIRNEDHMTLTITGGPKYVGKVQEWYRQ